MAEYLNVPYDCISDCCYKVKDQHNSHKTAYGYVFTTVELTKEEVIKRFQSYKRNFDYIYLYDINGNFLDKFDSYEKAIEQAKEYEHSLKREMVFLFVHGMLHLLGYDHMNEADEKVMFDLQDKILGGLK